MREIVDPHWRHPIYKDTGEQVPNEVLAEGITETCKQKPAGAGITVKTWRYFVNR